MTGTTHGSIIEINNQWYIFYHRLTHKSDYSRQACAERIEIQQDGKIKQVEVTSCGLNGKPLEAKGSYPAVIACNITNGKMPHGSNKIYTESFPNVTHRGNDRFIGEIKEGTLIGYKYFKFKGVSEISVTANCSGNGYFNVYNELGGNIVSKIKIDLTEEWTKFSAAIDIPDGIYPVYLIYSGSGEAELKEISFK